MSEKIWSDDAWRDYLYWQTQDKKDSRAKHRLSLLADAGQNLSYGKWQNLYRSL